MKYKFIQQIQLSDVGGLQKFRLKECLKMGITSIKIQIIETFEKSGNYVDSIQTYLNQICLYEQISK